MCLLNYFKLFKKKSSSKFLRHNFYICLGIISIIPVLLIVLVIILVTIARIIKCWRKSSNNRDSQRNYRRAHRRSQQVVYSIDTSDNSSIFDYNQALSCSVEIVKESGAKEDNLPSYQDALKMKPHE